MTSLQKFFAFLAMMVIGIIVGGFVFMKLWEWFIVYAFHVQPLNLMQSIGVSFFISFVRIPKYSPDEGDESDMETLTKKFLFGLIMSGIALGLGSLLTLFQ